MMSGQFIWAKCPFRSEVNVSTTVFSSPVNGVFMRYANLFYCALKNPGICCLQCSPVEDKNYEVNTFSSELAGPSKMVLYQEIIF